ncbi:BMP family lipoprotein [Vallicoccus soli]|uniref:BMP family ABC transporter substrate-binding protein n=1 Tax=Vallicoccus soli TaxID=2339232 RepID=A0A3A3ZIG0_9ACTN|nr:BMP family ABC transporter substrate-binding protein [Vallicoccus soli]RJK95286.1 BMP family ABC transporter substrate-binding protein [Vallicoccus soli]
MKNTIRLAALVSAVAIAAAGCGDAPEEEGSGSGSGSTSTSTGAATGGAGGGGGADFTGCMVSDSGGIDDRSFNASAWAGLQKAETDLGIAPKFVESRTDADYGPNINSLVADDCGIIVTVGFLMGDATSEAATANPEERFAIVDSAPETPIENVKPLSFNTAEAAFLGGYLAAGMSESGTVATFGGAQIPPVTIFMDGFVDGVAYYNEQKGTDVQVLGWDKAAQNGSFTGDFEDQNKGRQLAQNFISQGADVILPVAGPVGLGAAAAAEASGSTRLVWVDSDGTETAPQYAELFLSSVLKRVDNAVEAATADALEGDFTNEAYVGTLENEGVGLAPLAEDVPEELAAEIEEVRQGIIDGTIAIESDSSPA